ncbi:hypothetical protein EN35_05070 [Rhodococcus qingshengii]|nr:hypothetical protein EN35_05070 [Rhodococcus qingshengii]
MGALGEGELSLKVDALGGAVLFEAVPVPRDPLDRLQFGEVVDFCLCLTLCTFSLELSVTFGAGLSFDALHLLPLAPPDSETLGTVGVD